VADSADAMPIDAATVVVPIEPAAEAPTNRPSAKDGKECKKVHHPLAGKFKVTQNSRVKMVHADTKRTSAWTTKLLKDQKDAPTLKLEAIKQEAGMPEFGISVRGSVAMQDIGLKESGGALEVCDIKQALLNKSPLQPGDRVMSINDQPVKSVEDVRRNLRSGKTMTISVIPGADEPKDKDEAMADLATCGVASIDFCETDVIFAEGVDLKAELKLVRTGDTSTTITWKWGIENGNVVPKIFDKLTRSGVVEFQPGCSIASIEIDIPQDPTWNAESVYFVYLDDDKEQNSQNGVQVVLGEASQVNVYSVNMNSFPANVYGSFDIHKHDEDPGSSLSAASASGDGAPSFTTLAAGFVRHNYTEIPEETIYGFLLCLIPPLLFYISQVNFALLVNCVLAAENSCTVGGVDLAGVNDIAYTLTGIFVTVKIGVVLVGYITEVLFRRRKLGGKAVVKLRGNVFTTMLQMSDTYKGNFDEGDTAKILDTGVQNAVDLVWMKAFQITRDIGGLLIKVILTYQMTAELRGEALIVLLFCLPGMTAIATIMFRCRAKAQHELHYTSLMSDHNWAALSVMCSDCVEIIRQYGRGWNFVETFQECHMAYNRDAYVSNAHKANTVWFLKLIFAGVSVLVIIIAAPSARDGTISVGNFLVLTKTLDSFGADLLNLSKDSFDMVVGTSAVKDVALVLNAKTRRMERYVYEKRKEVKDHVGGAAFSPDHVELKKVRFQYPDTEEHMTPAVSPLDMTLPCGSLVCFPLRSTLGAKENLPGIHTFFSILEGTLMPSGGVAQIPGNWTVIYVPVMPVLFDGTLMYNLMFSEEVPDPSLVWDVCGALGLSPDLLRLDDFDVGTKGRRLKFSDRVIINIARAVLHNVDMLLISSALDVLGESQGLKVLRYLRHYTRRRGLPNSRLPYTHRQVKTVIFSSKSKMLQEQAHYQLEVGGSQVGAEADVEAEGTSKGEAKAACDQKRDQDETAAKETVATETPGQITAC